MNKCDNLTQGGGWPMRSCPAMDPKPGDVLAHPFGGTATVEAIVGDVVIWVKDSPMQLFAIREQTPLRAWREVMWNATVIERKNSQT
jgi:hypothetical protein